MQFMHNESLGGEMAGPQSFTSPDARHWAHSSMPLMAGSPPLDDAGSTRLMSVHERSLPYRVPADTGVQHRPSEVATASTIWADPYVQGQGQSGTSVLSASSSLRTGSGTYGRRWRNRGTGVGGRAVQTANPSSHLNWGVVASAGGQDIGISSTQDTNWQGDQGIPWRRDGFSVYPWVVSESESQRWTSVDSQGWSPFHQPATVASSSSHNSDYYGAHGLGNGAFRGPSVFPGFSSTLQHDGSGDIGSMHPHSSMRPMR
eukprot:Gb_39916 [translate_table: standard]